MNFLLPHLRVPFSAPGSLLGISPEIRKDPRQYHLRTLHRFADPRDLYALHLGTPSGVVCGEPALRPECLTLATEGGSVEAVFAGPQTVRLRVRGATLHLRQAAGVAETMRGDAASFTTRVFTQQLAFRFRALTGKISYGHGGKTAHPDRLWVELQPDAATGVAELAIDEIVDGQGEGGDETGEMFDAIVERRAAEFRRWRARFDAAMPNADSALLTEAAYLFWACQAGPRGPLERRAVFMSKNWMTAIWSWDNCFNARALAAVDPALAWDQFMYFFDHQSPGGRAPDLVTAFYTQWGMVKPPVYGWTLRHLRRQPWFREPERLAEAYEPMARQTRFWFEHRDSDQDGLPEYGDGCDSGWDNGTGFDDCLPAASPDLAAWLVIQLEELADLAPRVGKPAEAAAWRTLADQVVRANARHCWDGARWLAAQADTHRRSPHGDSLLPQLVGLMGHRLDPAQRAAAAEAIGDPERFLAPAGVASESVSSPLYEDDGYWRGPVWGASNVAAAEAAARCGRLELAVEIARRFDATCRGAGFAENYDARTGAGLRDRGYTWTAAAWMILQQDWLGTTPTDIQPRFPVLD